MTIAQLIELLKDYDPTEYVVFQFLAAEHLGMKPKQFAKVAEYVQDNDQFIEDITDLMKSWITEGKSVLADLKEQEN